MQRKGRREVVLGLAYGYKWISLIAFVRSLRASGYKGDVWLFVSPLPTAVVEQLRQLDVDTIEVSLEFPYSPSLLSETSGYSEADFHGFKPHVQRYAMYWLWLTKQSQPYDRIFFTDVKDVVFQRVPFDVDAAGNELLFFAEDDSVRIQDCSLNSEWIRRAFGDADLERIRQNPIICSGTTMAMSHEAAISYVEAMLNEARDRKVNWVGGDQGICNWLVHSGRLKAAKVFGNEDGPVLTLYNRHRQFEFNNDGKLLNTKGQVPNVVHQYDRFPTLLQWVERQYFPPQMRAYAMLSRTKRSVLSTLKKAVSVMK